MVQKESHPTRQLSLLIYFLKCVEAYFIYWQRWWIKSNIWKKSSGPGLLDTFFAHCFNWFKGAYFTPSVPCSLNLRFANL